MVVTHGSLQRARGRCALTIGNFDGVHRGHRALIDRVIAQARESELTSCVLTFEPHPREFFAGEAAPARLTRLRDKLELLAAGRRRARACRALRRALRRPGRPSASSTKCWCAAWACAGSLVGRDFRFGARRAGDFATLEAAAQRHGLRSRRWPTSSSRASGYRARRCARRSRRATCAAPSGCSAIPTPSAAASRMARSSAAAWAFRPPTSCCGGRRRSSGIFVVEVDSFGRGVASVGRRPTVNPVAIPLLEVHLFDRDERSLRRASARALPEEAARRRKVRRAAGAAGRDRARRAAGKGVLSEPWLTTRTR